MIAIAYGVYFGRKIIKKPGIWMPGWSF